MVIQKAIRNNCGGVIGGNDVFLLGDIIAVTLIEHRMRCGLLRL